VFIFTDHITNLCKKKSCLSTSGSSIVKASRKVKFDGEDVANLKEMIKKRLKPRLDHVATTDITLHLHDEKVALEPDRVVE